MALTAVEKCAGLWFRKGAEQVLTQDLLDNPDSAPCSALTMFFRHECPQRKGRTRSIRLDERSLTSPEMWVTVREGKLAVISPSEAQYLVDQGEAVEAEHVLAGKFSFTWKKGQCRKCGLTAVSREGILRDLRPERGARQGDLSSFAQGPSFRATRGVIRERE